MPMWLLAPSQRLILKEVSGMEKLKCVWQEKNGCRIPLCLIKTILDQEVEVYCDLEGIEMRECPKFKEAKEDDSNGLS